MANLNQAMLREPPPFIDKLLMTCLVNLERIELLRCKICDNLYCQKESLNDHLTTHIKTEIANNFDEITTYKESACAGFNSDYSNIALNVTNTCNKIKSEVVNSATQGAFLSIRDRIKFETEDTIDAAIRATCGEIKQMTIINVNSSKSPDTSSNSNNQLVPVAHMNLKKSYGSLLPCQTCNEKFVRHSTLKWHEAMCHNKSQIVKKPKQIHLVDIKKQMRTKHICDICWIIFPSNHQLSLHSKFHDSDSDKTWKCNICEKTFKFSSLLKNHQRVHTNERPYSCATCNVFFRNSSSLYYHNRSKHTPEEQLPTCDLCNMHYPEKKYLERHMLSVHMTTGYPCRICKSKKEYGHPINLAKHMYTHKGYGHMCHLCKKTFASKFHKDRHVKLIHKKVLNYECDMCKKKFGRKDDLVRHITNKCWKFLNYKCDMCKKKFGRKDNLVRHITSKCCLEPYKCRKCKSSYSKLVNFRKHKIKCKKK